MKKGTLLLLSCLLLQVVSAQQYGIVYDVRDNQTYRTVIIGNQLWMAENLNFETDSGSWCYDNSNANCQNTGRLYNQQTAKQACMDGWRLPTKQDFDSLLLAVNEGNNPVLSLLKNGNSGFDALMAGWYGEYSGSYFFGEQARFWSLTTKNTLNAWYLSINILSNYAGMEYESRESGYSVRCIKK